MVLYDFLYTYIFIGTFFSDYRHIMLFAEAVTHQSPLTININFYCYFFYLKIKASTL